MVIVASQRLEPEGLGALLLRKPETGRNLLKAVGGEERAGSWFYPSLWSPKPVLLPCNKLDLLNLRGHFHGTAFAMDLGPAAK